jgi:hypothetical protein
MIARVWQNSRLFSARHLAFTTTFIHLSVASYNGDFIPRKVKKKKEELRFLRAAFKHF